MKKQSSRARAQSTPPVRHQLEHAVPTVIHNPEEDMTALGRWAHHAMLEPGRYLGWPLAIVVGVILLALAFNFASGRSSAVSDVWDKLETAKTPAERVDIARANPKSPASTWAMLQAGIEFYNQALMDMPNNRDVALSTSKKALDLFEDVLRDARHDEPQARAAALAKGRVLEMRNELPEAIKQYERVAQDPAWHDSPEAREAQGYAEALKDPKAAEFYKELYAYSPTKVTLPPEGSVTLPPTGLGPMIPPPPSGPPMPVGPLSNQPPTLSPGLGAIPGLREVVEPQPAAPSQPKAGTPDAKSPPAKPTEAPKEKAAAKNLPADVFAPKTGETKK